jgi:hypothetical protein
MSENEENTLINQCKINVDEENKKFSNIWAYFGKFVKNEKVIEKDFDYCKLCFEQRPQILKR